MPNPDAPECSCGLLERLAKEPAAPVVFDPELNEYHIEGEGDGGRVIRVIAYHCPHCGGRMPKSRRRDLFMHITAAEHDRLKGIVRNLESVSDVLATLGPPDRDDRAGYSIETRSKRGRSSVKLYRELRYSGVSTMADILVTVHPNEKVGFGFVAKPVGGKKIRRSRRGNSTQRKGRGRAST
jgi:hypothetical protein